MKKVLSVILATTLLITTIVIPSMVVEAVDNSELGTKGLTSFVDKGDVNKNDPRIVAAREKLDSMISSGSENSNEVKVDLNIKDVYDKHELLNKDNTLKPAIDFFEAALASVEYTSGDYTYVRNNNEVTITKVNTSISGAVTVPTTLGGYNVTTIGTAAFSGCENITSITIGDKVKSINENAFVGCTGITSISIGSGVKTINPSAFLGCISVSRISVSSSNTVYYSSGNCLIERETGTLVLGCKNSSIPNDGTITAIGPNAFYFCALYSIVIPNSVTKIGNSAFLGSTITSIDLGQNVTTIDAYAFACCDRLTNIYLSDSTSFIGDYAFIGCENLYFNIYSNCYYLGNSSNEYIVLMGVLDNSLTSYSLPSGIKCIYDEAFSQCINLKNFTIPNTVACIGSFAFANCSSLTNLTVPDSVSSIGDSTFLDCDKLVYNTYNNGKYLGNSSNRYVVFIAPTSKSISEFTFANGVRCIYSKAFAGCRNLKNISLPGSVSNISEGAFEGCTNLKTIYLSGKVKYIRGFAFYGCTSLVTVTFTSNVSEIGGYAFYDCPSLRTVNYKGTEQNKNKMLVQLGNEKLINATWNYLEYNEYSGTTSKPVKPIVVDYTSESVTLYPFEGYEFSMDGVVWQTSNFFNNLEDETTYTFYQRIKTPSNSATASNISLTTARFGWDTNVEFDYLRLVINNDYNYLEDGYPSIRVYEDFSDDLSGYYAITDYGSYIRFTLLMVDIIDANIMIGEITEMDMRKTTTTLDVSHFTAYYDNGTLIDSAFGTGTIERNEHENDDKYEFYRSGLYITPTIFCNSFNSNFAFLNLLVDLYLSLNYNSGLNALGFISYDGYGPKNCDLHTGYHVGTQERRGSYNAGCVIDGSNGHVYCSLCDQKLQSATVIRAKGEHTYDNGCDKTCNTCNEQRLTEHIYTADCDDSCDFCSAKRIPPISHTYNNTCDTTCNICDNVRVTTHTWKADYSFDNNAHWKECSVCGEKKETPISHIYNNSCDTTCNVCANTREITHTWDEEHSFDGNSHWIKCSICGEKKGNPAVHIYDNSCDTTCNVCGDARTITHNYKWIIDKESDCGYSGLKHEECTICKAKRNENTVISATGNHKYDNNCDTTCNVCSKTRVITHIWDEEYSYNNDGHWIECSICGEKKGNSIAHNYDNACDTTCNVCDKTRTITHNYKWVIDKENNCGVSGFKHEECTICHIRRNNNTVIDATGLHTYSSDCDEKCNVCNSHREVNTSHSFAEALSTNCKYCEHTRKLIGLFVSTLPAKLTYLKGIEELNLSGGEVTLFFDDETTSITAITADMVTGFDNTKEGEQTLTITYSGKTATLIINIIDGIPGDVNSDGEVNVVDLALLKKMVAGLSESLDVDLNGDGKTDVVDLALLKKMVAGLA